MELLVNELSIHGQFPDTPSFLSALRQIMEIRGVARRFGRSVYCNRNMLHAQVTMDKGMRQVVQALTKDERGALLQWLTRHGPFWDETRAHGPDDWIECNSQIVTDTSIGEAAWCRLNGIERGLVSFSPSNWLFSPLLVDWVTSADTRKSADVPNFWDALTVEAALQTARVPLASWNELREMAKVRYTRLTFAVDAFAPLNGQPFVSGAAQRLVFIFETLNRLKSCFDVDGKRTSEGHDIHRNFFTGKTGDGGRGALFCDSSGDEKEKFKTEMTFGHPGNVSDTLFCPWHGKVQTPQLRVHFSFPVRADEPLFIVYVGPKITKR
jgi:hypothetical protein